MKLDSKYPIKAPVMRLLDNHLFMPGFHHHVFYD
jgi:hypothetical protein